MSLTPKLLLTAFLSVAYARQIALVDLSKQTTRSGPPYPPHSERVTGGGVYDGPQKAPESAPIRLVLTRFIPTRVGVLVRYVAEVVITNVSDAPISLPVGADPDSLLAPKQHDRSSLVFTAAFAKSGRGLPQSGAASASNSEHPESSALLEPGDAAVFLLPVGAWLADKVPVEEVRVSVRRQHKVVEGATDWTEPVGPEIRSENSLPLPPAPDQ